MGLDSVTLDDERVLGPPPTGKTDSCVGRAGAWASLIVGRVNLGSGRSHMRRKDLNASLGTNQVQLGRPSDSITMSAPRPE
jgi:hypothetical protein